MAVLSAIFEATDRMSDALGSMADSGSQAIAQFEQAGEAANAAFEQTSQAANSVARAMETSADALGDVTVGAEEVGDGLSEAGEHADEFGEKSVNSIEMLQDALVAAGITKLLSAIGDAFVDCTKDAIEFESAITGVYKTVDGTPEQLAGITNEVKELATRIPSTTTEISGVAEAAGQLGIATEDIMSFTEVMINLGEATNLSADEAASSLAKFANVTKLDPKEYENLGSTVVALGNNFATTEADIVAMSTRMASAGTLAGLSESQILALAASLSSVGVEADAGGSAMSTLLSRMQLAVEAGTDELQQYAAVSNMTVDEFSQKWGQDAVGALYAFISGLNDTERNGASATAILDEMGISEIRLSNAVKALANNHEGLAGAINLAGSAWQENTALANEANTRYATLESRLSMTKNAANNLSIAVGEDLSNAISSLLPAGTTVINGITTIVEKCPVVTAVIVGATGALATLVAGVTAYTLYTKYATAATTAFTAAMNANPIILAATAVVGLGAGLFILATNIEMAVDEYDKLTVSSQKQYDEVERLNVAYENACKTYGETSYEAHALKSELEDARAEFEANKQTYEDFEASLHETSEAMAGLRENYNKNVEEIDKENARVTALIGRLEELTTADDGTAASQAEILGIVEELNKQFPELNLNYEDVINNSSATIEALNNMALAEYNSAQASEAWDTYVDAMGKVQEAKVKVTTAEEQLAIAQEKVVKLRERDAELMAKDEAGELVDPVEVMELSDMTVAIFDAEMAVRQYEEALETANEEMEKAQEEANGYAQKFAEASGITLEAAEASNTLSDCIDSVALQVQNLTEEYQNAYTAALDSFSGQFGLFDTAKADMESTVSAAQQALDSQLSFWQTYADNVNTLKGVSAEDLGVTQENYDTIMAYAQSGTEEAAGFAQSLANAVNSGNTEAITKLADTVGQVKAAREQAAGEVAAWQTDFENKMNAIVQKMETSMGDLDMSAEATTAAASTMNAYAQSVLTNGAKAVANAKSIAAQIKSALESASATVNINTTGGGTGKGYASGTTNATPGFHIVGENGPEIIAFAGGETVYDAAETERMLSADRPTPLHVNAPESVEGQKTQNITKSEKRVVIALEGGGEIKVPQGVDKETVMQILTSNLRPALLNIIQEEIFEEGEGSYAY